MTIIEDNNKDDEEISNVIPFKRGSGEINPPWLRSLKEGTCFLCQSEDSFEGRLNQWIVVKHFSRSSLLISTINSQFYQYVEDAEFSRENHLVEILGEVSIKDE